MRSRSARPACLVALDDTSVFSPRVIARRREFRCLLGNRPGWSGKGERGGDEEVLPVDEVLVDRLQVRLGPEEQPLQSTVGVG